MLQSSFYRLVSPLGACRSFTDYLGQIASVATQLLGPGDYGVMTCHLREQRPVIEAGAESLESFETLAAALHQACDKGKLGDEPRGGPRQATVQEFLDEWIESQPEFAPQSVKVARLCRGEFFSSFLVGVKRQQGFTEDQAETFAALGLYSEQLVGRVGMMQYDKEVRRQLFAFRAECPAAYFQYDREQGLVPMNHQAVEFSESHWDRDTPALQLSQDQAERMDEIMAASWRSPIESFWSALELDLGAGEREAFVIPRTQGDAVVMVQTRPKREALAKASDYLTKRQEEIMDWIAEGKTSGEVAVILEISPRTVEKHLEAIFQRLGVENRTTAVRRYLELKGLIEV